jgi:NADH dehydrogenase
MRKVLIVGGGYAGFTAARALERLLGPDEAEVTLVDPLPYMTYQPFLPEVAAGSVEARHSVVPFRRHLRRTRLVAAKVTFLDHASRTATLTAADGTMACLRYDVVAVTAGAVTRTFPVPGLAAEAIGFKTIEEAVSVRDRLLANIELAATLPPGPDRDRLLTVVFVGGGFAGVEAFGELRSLATAVLRRVPGLSPQDARFHLVEATDRVLPEVDVRTSRWVVRHLASRGAEVHLGTQARSVRDGRVALSDGQELVTGLLVWTAGVVANPTVTRHTDLPLDDRGRILTRADLRVGTEDDAVPDAWAAGDDAAVPDVTGGGIGGTTVPNAQHAVRQGRLLARNITATLRGRAPRTYRHRDLGSVATLGYGSGVFRSGRLVVRGFPAWVVHRGYHVLAIPTRERTLRVLAGWALSAVLGRDTVGLRDLDRPQAAFREAARQAGAAVTASEGREAAREDAPTGARRTG